MQTLLIAQPHEAEAPGGASVFSRARLDAFYEACARALYRLTLVVGPAWYVARLAKSPLAPHLAQALGVVIAALLVHWLTGHVLKRLHLLSQASFDRPATWADEEADAHRGPTEQGEHDHA
jgi:hypothetical protein